MIALRHATAADAPLLAIHRVSMFRDMGVLPSEHEPSLVEKSTAYFRAAIPAGEYAGWLAIAPDARVIAGAGLQFRSLLPRPLPGGDGLMLGREGHVLNVYVDPDWRRRGIARQLMDAIIGWSQDNGIVRLVLSASAEGRPLYEKMGFVATREMMYTGTLAAAGPWVGSGTG